MASEPHMAEDEKAARIRAPYDYGRTADDYGGLKFASTTTHGVNPLPEEFSGRWVIMKATGGDVHYGFSQSASAEIDRAAAAASAGSTTQGTKLKVGGIVPDGLGYETHRQLPYWDRDQTMYLVHEGTASATLYVMLASAV